MFLGLMSVHNLNVERNFNLKKSIMFVKEFEIKIYMDYMAVKSCNDNTQAKFRQKLKTLANIVVKNNNHTLKVGIEYNKFSTCQGGWSRGY